ncbi:hypothetical protein [Bythopirellula polymerisocia]|uniref:Uncharacterized protein n=1 Tax=Bythopirellula polymerisocia TaxID=2528003 RepID=A0A5C6CN29_9BACT|nr:hypothetical protein [Bythopirellula polymerisocia]TWU25485.1 hypothetical protein Pla144_26900 [Bythopirellula polymerisocia]
MEPTRDILVRKSTLAEQGNETDLQNMTPAERMAMVWPLTIAAWAMKGEDIASQRLQRHVVRIERRRR